MTSFLWVGLGGFLGSCLRFGIGTLANFAPHSGLPAGTFVVNIVGSALAGAALGLGSTRLNGSVHLFLVPGFFGGFTTYSAFSAEVIALLASGQHLKAAGYFTLTSVLGLAAAAAGYALTRHS
jgi:CrcB protein